MEILGRSCMSKHKQCLRLEQMDRTKYGRMLVWGWFHKSKEFLNQLSNYYLLKDSSTPSGQLQEEREGKVRRTGCRWRSKEKTIASTRIRLQGFVQVRSSSKKWQEVRIKIKLHETQVVLLSGQPHMIWRNSTLNTCEVSYMFLLSELLSCSLPSLSHCYKNIHTLAHASRCRHKICTPYYYLL
jgi:hypothetical protein